MTIMAFS